ncbi:MAG TPA: adenosine deaminase [Candidatus Acidoferrales bacterium]|nr:adenosine deaminase [Candidatus Acidoferrales bacterium]
MPPGPVQSGASTLARIPKAELHVHLEGCLYPMQVVQLAARHGEKLRYEEVAARYNANSFPAFLELFKWATSYLRDPQDYALLCENPGLHLIAENCVYAEITLSVGVMLLRKQNVEANFSAILDAISRYKQNSPLRINWIFDAVRQFGPEKAMEVARLAAQMKSAGVVAFGLGGDEESLPASDFRKVFDYASYEGLHRVVHAGEMGGPQNVRDAIEILGAERIGHGIAAIHDESLMDLLIARQIPLEICPTSNLRTGALAKLLSSTEPRLGAHPLAQFIARGVPVTLASDDPAMFRTSLLAEYTLALAKMGLTSPQLISIAEAAFRHSLLPATEKQSLLDQFHSATSKLNRF